MGLGVRELPVFDLLGRRLLRLTLSLAVVVDERVGEDAVEPRLEGGAFLELMEGRKSLDERLLDEVLSVGRLARHPERRRVQLVEKWQRVAFEASAALLGRLLCNRLVGDGSHLHSLRTGGYDPAH